MSVNHNLSVIGERCHYCKTEMATTVDHIIPKALLGKDGGYNLVPCCVKCNMAKKSLWPDCECWKCTWAVTKFIGQPGMLEFAIKKMEFIAKTHSHHSRIKPPYQASLDRMYALRRRLTDDYTTDTIET